MKKIRLSILTLAIIFGTTAVFNLTQKAYISFHQGHRLYGQKAYDKALPYLLDAYRRNPLEVDYADYLAWNYLALGMKEEALLVLSDIHRLYPDNVRTVEILADTYYSLNKYAEAESHYRELVRLEPKFENIRKFAEVLAWQKQYDRAIVMFEELLKMSPDDARIKYFIAEMKSWSKKYDEAIALYREIMAAHPELAKEAGLKLADTLRYAGRDAEAIDIYREYIGDPK